MAQWRITKGHLVRELGSLDHERCAALHNLIVERGWTQQGFELHQLDKRTWWECYGGDAALASISARLDPFVVSFLQAAWHGYSMDTAEHDHDFHRYLWLFLHRKSFGKTPTTPKKMMTLTSSAISHSTWQIGVCT